MLFIDFDIKDAYITDPGFSVHTGSASIPVTGTGVTNYGVWRTPDMTTLMMQPYQLADSWGTKTKFGLSDYNLDTSAWEQIQRRGAGDYWLHSLGSVTEPVSCKYVFPRNAGFFVELWFYTKPDQNQYSLFDMSFGKWFSIKLHSDGSLDLFDSRKPGSPIASGSISGRRPVTINKIVTLLILPYRRTNLLIFSSLGGFMSVDVGSSIDSSATEDMTPGSDGLNVITESGMVSFYDTAEPVNAALSFSPLMYPDSASLTTPVYNTPYALTSQPTLAMNADQEMETSLAIEGATEYNADTQTTQFAYDLSFKSGNGSTGISGISSSNAAVLGNLYSPMDYMNRIDCERSLSARQYTTNTITKILSMAMRLDQDRFKTTFEFTLDNPLESWTSLKDFQNRRVKAYLNYPSAASTDNASSAVSPTNSDMIDPDAPLLEANGGKPIVLFEGYSERMDYLDGNASTVTANCVGLFKRLRHTLLSSSKDYDNAAHTTAVRDVLAIAGFVTSDDTGIGSDFPEQEVFIYDDGVNEPLPEGGAGSEPAWRPRDGVSAEDFLQQILDWSGWILFESAGSVYYCPDDYTILQTVLGITSIPTISLVNTQLGPGGAVTGQSTPNCDASMIAALDMSVTQTTDESVADDIWVVGMDDGGQPLIAHYEATPLITDRTQPYYIGARWPFILQNASLCTQDAVTTVCERLAAKLTTPTRIVEFTLPDYRLELAVGCPCYIDGYDYAIITAIDATFAERGAETSDRHRKAHYTAQLVS